MNSSKCFRCLFNYRLRLDVTARISTVIRPFVKLIFIVKAAAEVGRERVEDCLDSLTEKAGEYKSNGNDRFADTKDKVKEVVNEVSNTIWQRSEVLEGQMKEKLRRQVADFSLGALGDSSEINELRAEIATLRAEIAEIKAMTRAAV
jgi:polyhydroxyalkanoate synthesis regulator phasin